MSLIINNDLYIDDRISLEELQKRSSDFMAERTALEKELDADSSIKTVERKKDIRRVLDTKDIFSLDYEHQKAIARALISKVRVTSETIVILWKL
jgi:site-specific DNA recombinase